MGSPTSKTIDSAHFFQISTTENHGEIPLYNTTDKIITEKQRSLEFGDDDLYLREEIRVEISAVQQQARFLIGRDIQTNHQFLLSSEIDMGVLMALVTSFQSITPSAGFALELTTSYVK